MATFFLSTYCTRLYCTSLYRTSLYMKNLSFLPQPKLVSFSSLSLIRPSLIRLSKEHHKANLFVFRAFSSNFTGSSCNWGERLKKCHVISSWKKSFPGRICAYTKLREPYPQVGDVDILTTGLLILINQYAYKVQAPYLKITPGYLMVFPNNSRVQCSLGKAIPLHSSTGLKVAKN